MDEAVKLSVLAVMGALCALTIRRQTPELTVVLGLTTGVLILGFALSAVTDLWDFLDELTALAGLSPAVLSPLIKTIGIGMVTHIAASLCRDAGESGIAAFTETAGGVLALWTALPLMRSVVELITGLM